MGKVNRNVCPTFLAFALGAATGAHALGQALGAPDQLLHPQGGAAPSFEVASVKPNHNPDNVFSSAYCPQDSKQMALRLTGSYDLHMTSSRTSRS